MAATQADRRSFRRVCDVRWVPALKPVGFGKKDRSVAKSPEPIHFLGMSGRSLIAIGVLSALLGACTEGQSGPEAPENVLSGTVGTENNLAARVVAQASSGILPGARVYLWDPSRTAQPVDSTLADTRGRFTFRNLGAGPWVVSVATDSIGAVSGRRVLAGTDSVHLGCKPWIVDLVLLDPKAGETLEGVRILGVPGVQEASGNRVRLLEIGRAHV